MTSAQRCARFIWCWFVFICVYCTRTRFFDCLPFTTISLNNRWLWPVLCETEWKSLSQLKKNFSVVVVVAVVEKLWHFIFDLRFFSRNSSFENRIQLLTDSLTALITVVRFASNRVNGIKGAFFFKSNDISWFSVVFVDSHSIGN